MLVLAALEALAVLADRRWAFRARLLSAFDTATRSRSLDEARWDQPERLFDAGSDAAQRQPLRFRLPGSANPIGQTVDPSDLPAGRRVVVLGESAAFGVGCKTEDTFAALLDASLQARGTRVLNAGQVGADAWQILDAGAQIVTTYDPAVLVIFTGNNLWIDWTPPQQPRWSPFGITVLSTLATSRAIAAVEFLSLRWILLHTPRQWRVEQLAKADALLNRGATFHDHYELTGSRYAVEHPLEESAEFGPADWPAIKQRYLQRFETSLETLIRQAQARGVRVVLVTVPFRYRLSPAWKHPQFEAVDPAHRDEVRTLVREAGRLVQAGDCGAALPLTERAVALDPLPPLPHYLRAQCLEQLGRFVEAEEEYAQSREQMIGNLGGRLSINEVIRRIGARSDVPVVDAAQLFADYARTHGHRLDDDLIIDDCHPSPLGHRLIADALAPLL